MFSSLGYAEKFILKEGVLFMLIVVCDDEATERERLIQMILHHPKYEDSFEILEVESAEELIQLKKEIDLLFLDIELMGINGLVAANKINEQQPGCLIVFVSSYWQYITESYHTDVCQFLIKPIREEIFEREFAFCLDKYDKRQACYLRKCQDEIVSIRKSEVVYLESRKRIVCAYMVNGDEHCYYSKLSDEAEYLKDSGFVQCQKAYIVNMAYVESISYDGIQMTVKDNSGKAINVPVSREKKKYMEAMLKKYIADVE